jgi:DNA-directed RNA polymerase subunit RPC12/RpoP
MMKNDELLIIQYQAPISKLKAYDFHEQILKQKETGVILLPYYCSVISKPKDIDIQVELKKDKTTPWDFIDNGNYSPFDSEGKERLIFCTECGCNVEHYDAQYQYCPYCGKRHYFEKEVI